MRENAKEAAHNRSRCKLSSIIWFAWRSEKIIRGIRLGWRFRAIVRLLPERPNSDTSAGVSHRFFFCQSCIIPAELLNRTPIVRSFQCACNNTLLPAVHSPFAKEECHLAPYFHCYAIFVYHRRTRVPRCALSNARVIEARFLSARPDQPIISTTLHS